MKISKGVRMLFLLALAALGGYLLGQSKPLTGVGKGSCPVCQLVNQFGAKDRPPAWNYDDPQSKIDRKYRRNFR